MHSEFIPYGRHQILPEDIESVVATLKGSFITQGDIVPQFEEKISEKVLSKYSIAVNSATSALHLSCIALGITEGDIVWTSTNSFASSANCAVLCGASVDFIDIDLDNYNISIKNLENPSK